MRIVIFDDEPCIGLQLKKLLEESGNDMTVEYFQEWHTLQFYFSQHAHVDAVFMDICFQGSTQNGIDYAEKLAKSNSQTKFIYVTASGGLFAADLSEQPRETIRLSAKAFSERRCAELCQEIAGGYFRFIGSVCL